MFRRSLFILVLLSNCLTGDALEISATAPVVSVPMDDFEEDYRDRPQTLDRHVIHDLYFPPEDDHVFSMDELRALELSEDLRCVDPVPGYNPAIGPDGSIQYLYGSTMPTVICAVLNTTLIELEEGEELLGTTIGDSVQWNVGRMDTNTKTGVIVKPAKNGLQTSLTIATDRRFYLLTLKSDSSRFMARVCFSYPDEALRKWEKVRKAQEEEIANRTFDNGVYGGNLDFNYRVEGDKVPWKPLRVYNDGIKTFIDMPKSISHEKLPVLKGNNIDRRGLINKKRSEILDYRFDEDNKRFVADCILWDASLLIGTGSNKKMVRILHVPQKEGDRQ